jgi:hypothetical protein
MNVAPLDYMAQLRGHMAAAQKLTQAGSVVVKSDAFYGGVLGAEIVRNAMAETARSHGFGVWFEKYRGHWSALMRKRPDGHKKK